ncbi:MAG: hypothetical protein ACQEST_00445 [Bacteroidota bacterium]
MKFMRNLFPIFCLALLLQFCSSNQQPKICTDEFVMLSVTVLDQNNELADSVDIQVTNKSGTIYDCDEYLCQETSMGTYSIMHDGLREEISDQKEIIIVEGNKDDFRFREDFQFRDDGCHVQKIAGPDTVTLQSNE